MDDDGPLLEQLRDALAWAPGALGAMVWLPRSAKDAADRLRSLADAARCTAPSDADSTEAAHRRGNAAARLLDDAADAAGERRLAAAVDAVRAAHGAWTGSTGPAAVERG
jgi:hypothetical protein